MGVAMKYFPKNYLIMKYLGLRLLGYEMFFEKIVKCAKCFFFHKLASYQSKRVAIIVLRNENEQNVISYSQLRKWRMSLVKKFLTIYLFPTLYLKSKYI